LLALPLLLWLRPRLRDAQLRSLPLAQSVVAEAVAAAEAVSSAEGGGLRTPLV